MATWLGLTLSMTRRPGSLEMKVLLLLLAVAARHGVAAAETMALTRGGNTARAVSRRLGEQGAYASPNGSTVCSHVKCRIVFAGANPHTRITDFNINETEGEHHHCVSDLQALTCSCFCGSGETMSHETRLIHDWNGSKTTKVIKTSKQISRQTLANGREFLTAAPWEQALINMAKKGESLAI